MGACFSHAEAGFFSFISNHHAAFLFCGEWLLGTLLTTISVTKTSLLHFLVFCKHNLPAGDHHNVSLCQSPQMVKRFFVGTSRAVSGGRRLALSPARLAAISHVLFSELCAANSQGLLSLFA